MARSKTLTFGLDDIAALTKRGRRGSGLHPMLLKQIEDHVDGGLSGLPEPLLDLLTAVDRTYHETDAELSELETSLHQSSRERSQASDALEALFSALPDQLLRLDDAGRLLDARGGDEGHLLRGVKPRHLVAESVPEVAREAFRQALRRVSTAGTSERIDVVQGEGEARRHYEARLLPLRNGEVLLLVRDITDRVVAEQARAHQAQQEARADAMSQFAYIASHDLRAPLRAIANLAEWIEEDLENTPEGEAKKHIGLLRQRVERMDDLLGGLLEYSKVGREGVSLESVDVASVVHGIADLLGPPPGFTIVADASLPTLETARDPLERVLLNLITNAVKHHDLPTGRIEVAAQDRGDYYAISVRDDGPGIPEAQRERIFGMFQTFHQKKKVEGVGMGLALIKRIVESATGNIVVLDGEGRGAVFELTWPKVWRRDGRASWMPDQAEGEIPPPSVV
ncbi:MAG: PAS domain-containing protein [Myxococcales bacterium]|nr:PAS domain-containing protein [Myxococcales bacterium]